MLFIVDGMSMLTTFYFGTMPREYFSSGKERFVALNQAMRTPSGELINGVYAMTKSLFNIIEKCQPTHFTVAWDVSRETFRREIYPKYKAHRGATLPEIKKQVVLMKRLLKTAGICQCEAKGYEADDLIGTIARRFSNKVSVKAFSKDADILQLVSPNVKVWLSTKKASKMYQDLGFTAPKSLPKNIFEFDETTVAYFYNVYPHQMADFKALSGDSSDNIPGVAGIGEKTAIKLLDVFPSIEQMYLQLESLSFEEKLRFFRENSLQKSILEKLEKGKDAALLSKKLASICCEVPLTLKLDDLKLTLSGNVQSILDEYGFKSIKLPKVDSTKQQVLFAV